MEWGKFRKGMGPWLIFFGLSLLSIGGFLNASGAADYPTKPIQMIVPFGPGGATDIAARLISGKVSALLGQPVVVVNKTGGGGVIGAYAALSAPPDGYTILATTPQHVSAPFLIKGVTYDFFRDFAWVNLAMNAPQIFAIKKDSPWLTLEELIADAKKNPGKLTYGSPGIGSTCFFICEALKMEIGANITHIPMDSEAATITALLGSHISFTVPNITAASEQLKAGFIKALAMVDEKRYKGFPDIPTVVEKGLPNIFFITSMQYGVRSETASVIVEKLQKVFKEALEDKEVIERIEKSQWVVKNLGLKQAKEHLTKEYQKRLGVAKALNLIPK